MSAQESTEELLQRSARLINEAERLCHALQETADESRVFLAQLARERLRPPIERRKKVRTIQDIMDWQLKKRGR